MSQYSSEISKCLANWGKKAEECKGETPCLEDCSKDLRECLNIVFPPSTKTEFESDKINYMMSTIFFLSNRLAKATIGLSEFDKSMEEFERIGKQSQDSDEFKSVYENKKKELNDILAKYF